MPWYLGKALIRIVASAAVAATITGAGPAAAQTADGKPLVLPYRVVEAVGEWAHCDADEDLLTAYCFENPHDSLSVSGPALQRDSKGVMYGICLTGGKNLRLFCVKK